MLKRERHKHIRKQKIAAFRKVNKDYLVDVKHLFGFIEGVKQILAALPKALFHSPSVFDEFVGLPLNSRIECCQGALKGMVLTK